MTSEAAAIREACVSILGAGVPVVLTVACAIAGLGLLVAVVRLFLR